MRRSSRPASPTHRPPAASAPLHCAATPVRAACVALLLGLAGAPPSWAACAPSGVVITCSADSVQATRVGNGAASSGVTLDVLAGARIDVGNATAVSVGDNATLHLYGGALVQNNGSSANGVFGTGPNTIEFNSNNSLTIDAGASVVSRGSSGQGEAINPIGSGNTIRNFGLVEGAGGASSTIWFESGSGSNTVVNELGGVIRSQAGAGAIMGVSGTMAIDFTNRGSLEGSLSFANGDDTLRLGTGATISGVVRGGGGSNALVLIGEGVDTFATSRDISGFQRLEKQEGGSWTFQQSLASVGISSIKVAAGTLVLDTDASAFSGPVQVDGGTLQVDAARAPLAITNDALVRFQQSGDGTYNGIVSGSGAMEVAGGGTLLLTRDQAFAGTTTLNASTLQLGNGGNAGSVAGDIVDNGLLVIERSDRFTLAGAVSGSGALTQAGSGTTVLTADNSYSGLTTIAQGALQLGNGGSSGSVAGDILNNGALVIERGDRFVLPGVISGSGSLRQQGSGTTVLTGDSHYAGATTIAAGTLQLGDDGTSGSITSDIVNDGVLAIRRSDSLTLAQRVSGSGSLVQAGGGATTLSGANSYSGTTLVNAGVLRAGAANSFSALSAHVVAAGATLDLAGHDQTVAGLDNSGVVSLSGTAPGTTLTVTGALVGRGGVVRLATALGDSSSLSDTLVLDGASAQASGHTVLAVTNLGGLGALTRGDGITVVRALNGAATTAQTTHDAFGLAGGHVDAGAYEYRLYAADASGAGENWYLRSSAPVVAPAPSPAQAPASAPVPPSGVPTTVKLGASASAAPSPVVAPIERPTYRAEVPLYAALPQLLRQGDVAMLSNLHRRIGDEAQPIGAADDASTGTRRVWGRVLGSRSQLQQNGAVASDLDADLGGLQLGVDLLATQRWNAGLYFGQLRSDADVNGLYGLNGALGVAGYAGRLRVDTQYLGGYATYANPAGQYLDLVAQQGWQDISAHSVNGAGADTDGRGLSASVEAGQRFALGGGWGIEPQAQLVYNHLRIDDIAVSGAQVQQDSADAVIGRIGVRVTGDMGSAIGRLQPYGRVNLWHGFSGTDQTRFIGPAGSATLGNPIGYTSIETAAGLTLALTPSTSLYGEVGRLFHTGAGDAKVAASVQGSLGLKLRF